MNDVVMEQMAECVHENVIISLRDGRKRKGFIDVFESRFDNDSEASVFIIEETGIGLLLEESDIASVTIDPNRTDMRTCAPNAQRHKCPVCGKSVFWGRSTTYDICVICGWEDDRYMEDEPDDYSGANEMSLNEYRAAYQAGWRPSYLYENADDGCKLTGGA